MTGPHDGDPEIPDPAQDPGPEPYDYRAPAPSPSFERAHGALEAAGATGDCPGD